MNLDVFNRVNWKEPNQAGKRVTGNGMYSDWASLASAIHNRQYDNDGNEENKNVLQKFPFSASKQFALSISRHLAPSLGTIQESTSNLTNRKEVLFCMEVIEYGLSLPLTEHDTIRDCVNIYCEWISAIYPQPKANIPKPIYDDNNYFVRKIINHFHNLFLPRKGEGVDLINKQAVLCHRVLRTLQHMAQTCSPSAVQPKTWNSLLLFLLSINDTLLAPPTTKDDVGDQLCERVLSVLFEIWLVSCVKCYPGPTLWKTLRELAAHWRHRTALIEQWTRVNVALTSQTLRIIYASDALFNHVRDNDEELISIIKRMPDDCAVQTWFRMLHTIGNPAELRNARVISQTPQFLQYAISNENASCEHPSLMVALPVNFYKAVKGIAAIVDAFLGITPLESFSIKNAASHIEESVTSACIASNVALPPQPLPSPDLQHSPTPPSRRRLIKSSSTTSYKSSGKISQTAVPSRIFAFNAAISSSSSAPLDDCHSYTLSPLRPKCDSILHLFGKWLFEAAHDTRLTEAMKKNSAADSSSMGTPVGSGPASVSRRSQRESVSQPSSLGSGDAFEVAISPTCSLTAASMTPRWEDRFARGRAEAVGSLCRIICSKKSGEEILPVYLSRFYIVLQQAFAAFKEKRGGILEEQRDEVIWSILSNCGNILKSDVDGSLLLVPYLLDAMQVVLPATFSPLPQSPPPPPLASSFPHKQPQNRLKNSMANIPTSVAAPISENIPLRTACVDLLISMLPLPLHFQDLPLKELPGWGGQSHDSLGGTYGHLRGQMVNLLLNCLQVETNSRNTHSLLGGLFFAIQDYQMFESSHRKGNAPSESHQPAAYFAADTLSMASRISSDRNSFSGDSILSGSSSLANSNTADNDATSFDTSASPSEFPQRRCNRTPLYKTPETPGWESLFVRTAYVVSSRLVSSWKTDLNVSLAALELLSGLARLSETAEIDVLECERTVKWICDYITYQCSRPPTAHSKDLHSTIVGAFHCISVWLIHRGDILADRNCMYTLLEVVELGISGAKSSSNNLQPGRNRFKDEKELKPASMRVRDAAEALLSVILERVDYGTEIVPYALCCLLDEVSLLKQCCSSDNVSKVVKYRINEVEACARYQYFIIPSNSCMLALLQEPLGNDQDAQPTITLLIRNGFGRYAWTLQLRHLPRHRSVANKHQQHFRNIVTSSSVSLTHNRRVSCRDSFSNTSRRYFPAGMDQIPACKADNSIPTLESLLQSEEERCLANAIKEKMTPDYCMMQEEDGANLCGECEPPVACDEFHTARLFLSHMGFLPSDDQQDDGECAGEGIVSLDSCADGFVADLKLFDGMPFKTCDTCFVFYARSANADEILNNSADVSSQVLGNDFIHLLHSLGWPVSIREHPGWTGRPSTSFKPTTAQSASGDDDENKGGRVYDGGRRIFYWTDAMSELAFILPTTCSFKKRKEDEAGVETDGIINNIANPSMLPERSMSLDSYQSGRQAPFPHKRKLNHNPHTIFMLIWLESFEDYVNFPTEELLEYAVVEDATCKLDDCFVIFVHPLQNGLLRVKIQAPFSNRINNAAIPLVDGMLVSQRVAGSLIRQSILNASKRRRLDCDGYQLPHVCRKMKLQEMSEKYARKMPLSELLPHVMSHT